MFYNLAFKDDFHFKFSLKLVVLNFLNPSSFEYTPLKSPSPLSSASVTAFAVSHGLITVQPKQQWWPLHFLPYNQPMSLPHPPSRRFPYLLYLLLLLLLLRLFLFNYPHFALLAFARPLSLLTPIWLEALNSRFRFWIFGFLNFSLCVSFCDFSFSVC